MSRISTVDIITSALNEEECLNEFYSRIVSVLKETKIVSWRLIICDNGSKDNTWETIKNLAHSDSRVIGIKLSRTFSLDASYSCGLRHANADVVVIMACDLQDPPEVIPDLIKASEMGFDHVMTRVTHRPDVPFIRRIFTYFYYRLAQKYTGNMIQQNLTDFRLIKRKVYLALNEFNEQNIFLRGIVNWSGFTSTTIEIYRNQRYAGKSVFLDLRVGKVVSQAINSMLGFTSAPLVFVSKLGATLSLISLFSTCIFSFIWITKSIPFAGFGTIVGLIMIGFSTLLMSIGIIAQYISLIYEEVKQRPTYIIEELTF